MSDQTSETLAKRLREAAALADEWLTEESTGDDYKAVHAMPEPQLLLDAAAALTSAHAAREAAEQERDRLVAALDAAMCPMCDQTIRHGHAPDCPQADQARATAEQQVRKWEPIETAPKTGTGGGVIPVIARIVASDEPMVMWAYWNQRLSWWYRFGASEPTRIYPTHWTGLPDLPVQPPPSEG
jgi:hypothetical protein